MILQRGGINIFYIDESHDNTHYVVTAVCVPFLRSDVDLWRIVWPDFLDQAKSWRKTVRTSLHIPNKKELHGVKLASCRGNFLEGKHNFKYRQAFSAYSKILQGLSFLPDASVMSAVATKGGNQLYGRQRLEAAMYGLFQRMGRKCTADQTNGLAFFDRGHPEYRDLYRMAQRYLPTGSYFGQWEGGKSSKSMPISMFTKDANEKNSKHCFFTQIADLIAYSVFVKIKGENNQLTPWQKQYGLESLYDHIPKAKLNIRASNFNPRDAIVRIK